MRFSKEFLEKSAETDLSYNKYGLQSQKRSNIWTLLCFLNFSKVLTCSTLRSGLHELEKNHARKWTSDNFPGMLTNILFLENCQKTICMHGYSPIHVDRSLRVSYLGDKLVPYFWEEKNDLSTWIGEQPCIKIYVGQFSRNNMYVSIPGKLPEINLHAWLFSNPCGKVLRGIASICNDLSLTALN